MTPHDAPELAFRLIGTWGPVDLESDEAASASASAVARGTLGTRDHEATARRRVRDDLVSAAASARDAHATLVLLLAARIHGTDEAVRASAKSVVKKLPRSKRDLIYKVIDSRSPLDLVDFLAQHLDE